MPHPHRDSVLLDHQDSSLSGVQNPGSGPVARLSLLKDRHINFLGRYPFNIKASDPGQSLRPSRGPDAAEDNEEEA
ncbi:hypothetical protein [Streptomyces sp. MMS24-I29]|uniref:hypothetical protein n=1 Tax=Streptomyces sp. MMS24-I29 TaxID=3351480 RepID=UPI003C7A4A91